jgi:hypothetical protein
MGVMSANLIEPEAGLPRRKSPSCAVALNQIRISVEVRFPGKAVEGAAGSVNGGKRRIIRSWKPVRGGAR